MRRIQVRGQRIDNGQWVYGTGVIYDFANQTWITGTDKDGIFKHAVKPETVGEFVGYTDINGTDVYEHDLVRIRLLGCTGEVKWHLNGFDVYIGKREATSQDWANSRCLIDDNGEIEEWICLLSCEIIGNVHESHLCH